DPGRAINASMWHSAVSRTSRAAVSAICLVLCACTLLLYKYQAPEPTRTKPNKPLVTSITLPVVGIFIAPQQQHRSSRRPSPDGIHNRSNGHPFEIGLRKWSGGSQKRGPKNFWSHRVDQKLESKIHRS